MCIRDRLSVRLHRLPGQRDRRRRVAGGLDDLAGVDPRVTFETPQGDLGMTEGESSAGAVSYREGDTPVTLPGLSVVGVKLIGLYLVVRTISQSVAMPFY